MMSGVIALNSDLQPGASVHPRVSEDVQGGKAKKKSYGVCKIKEMYIVPWCTVLDIAYRLCVTGIVLLPLWGIES
jgi:hypothetical protein